MPQNPPLLLELLAKSLKIAGGLEPKINDDAFDGGIAEEDEGILLAVANTGMGCLNEASANACLPILWQNIEDGYFSPTAVKIIDQACAEEFAPLLWATKVVFVLVHSNLS